MVIYRRRAEYREVLPLSCIMANAGNGVAGDSLGVGEHHHGYGNDTGRQAS